MNWKTKRGEGELPDMCGQIEKIKKKKTEFLNK